MDSYIVKVFLSVGFVLIGAAGWITAERFRMVPPYCLVTPDTYDQYVENPAAPSKRR